VKQQVVGYKQLSNGPWVQMWLRPSISEGCSDQLKKSNFFLPLARSHNCEKEKYAVSTSNARYDVLSALTMKTWRRTAFWMVTDLPEKASGPIFKVQDFFHTLKMKEAFSAETFVNTVLDYKVSHLLNQ
jgi:hypothetical protein